MHKLTLLTKITISLFLLPFPCGLSILFYSHVYLVPFWKLLLTLLALSFLVMHSRRLQLPATLPVIFDIFILYEYKQFLLINSYQSAHILECVTLWSSVHSFKTALRHKICPIVTNFSTKNSPDLQIESAVCVDTWSLPMTLKVSRKAFESPRHWRIGSNCWSMWLVQMIIWWSPYTWWAKGLFLWCNNLC